MKRFTPWQKIARAGEADRGVRLSADEVAQLCMDEAIMSVARNDDQDDDIESLRPCACGYTGVLGGLCVGCKRDRTDEFPPQLARENRGRSKRARAARGRSKRDG